MAPALRTFVLILAAGLAATPAVPAIDVVQTSEVGVLGATVDKDKVRYGDQSTFDESKQHKVGTVRSKEVYDETDERKTIDREKIQKGTARYNQLMKQATQSYKAALKKVSSDKSLKLIVEEGGISGYDAHTSDVTSDVISAL